MIYLDHHAATPLSEVACRAMDEARTRGWANPSSTHAAGRAARAILEQARERIARAIGAAPAEVVLTSGGTEACNLAIFGMAAQQHRAVVTTAVEHPAVAAPIAALEARGLRVVRLPVPRGRPPDPHDVSRAITRETAFVAIQLVNHETGTIFPVQAYAAICRARGVPLLVDAVQALGKVALDVGTLGASAVALAAHKIGGPAGAGALWIARDADVAPLIHGGAQQRGRRGGTLDVVAHAGFGAACEALGERLAASPAIAARRSRLEAALVEAGASANAPDGSRVATVVNASVPGWRSSALVAALDLEGVCVASGAACSSGLERPSPVIAAMHADEPWRAEGALRLSLGPETSDEDVERAIDALRRVLKRPPA